MPRPEPSTETKLLSPRLPHLRLRRFSIDVVQGIDAGLHAQSTGDEFAIGIAPGNELVLRDRSVSRHHCTILSQQRSFLLRDLGSTNGTFVNGLRVETAYIHDGVVIRVGVSHLRFSVMKEALKKELSNEDRFGELVGVGVAMRRLFAVLPRIAASDSTVLLHGETGTGKSLLAEAIHRASPRASGPFVVLDCATIAPTLMESELFGHEKGSFTGAHHQRIGAIEQARGGTLLLDEIGELPLDMQPKLLRAIEERSVRRVGGSQPIQVDCRILVATNRDLRLEVNRGGFRSDLYYRLNTFPLRLPPLRERRDDIPALIEYFLSRCGQTDGVEEIAAKLAETWAHRDWHGNARELRNAVERIVVLGELGEGPASARVIASIPPPAPLPSGSSLPALADFTVPYRDSKARVIARWERDYVRALLEHHQGNLSAAARAVDMDRNYLRQLARRHGVLK